MRIFPIAVSVLCLLALANAAAAAGPSHLQLAARYLAQAQTPQCAAVQLLADEQDYALSGDDAESALQWFIDYAQLNRFNQADTYSQLLGQDWDSETHNRFWLEQAQAMLDTGESSNVEHALRRLREPVDAATAREREALLGRVFMQQRRFAEAADAFESAATDSGDAFDRYNLALALIRQGGSATAKGQKLLDELRLSPSAGDDTPALRDRINLALGWSWLALQKGGTARPYFRQVRLESPDASLALLGMGWAEVAPNGTPQYAPLFMGFYYEFLFEPAVKGPERLRRALRLWKILTQRPLHEPPVQEALLATAYLHERLKDGEAAASAYRHAIRKYQVEITRLDELVARLNDPASDPRVIMESNAAPGEFTGLVASQAFKHADTALQSLNRCNADLQAIRDRTDFFQRGLLERLDRYEMNLTQSQLTLFDRIRRLTLADIGERRQRLRTYLARGSLALATLQDQRGASP